MRKADARMLIAAIAKAVRERFVRRSDHDALVQRVETLERQIAELKSKREEAA